MFTKCKSFEEYRRLGLKQAEGDMNMFERVFIRDGDDVHERAGAEDGDWADLGFYLESDYLDVPTEYPIIVYGKVIEVEDRFAGTSKIWIWDWITLNDIR